MVVVAVVVVAVGGGSNSGSSSSSSSSSGGGSSSSSNRCAYIHAYINYEYCEQVCDFGLAKLRDINCVMTANVGTVQVRT